MFRSTGHFDKLLDKATSNLIMEPDWNAIMQICDLIRQNDIQPKYALTALKKKLTSTNPHTALYALQLLESMVKNCGTAVHEELTTHPFCEALHELAKTTHEMVRNKLLELIQVWSFAFRKNPKHGALRDLMAQMKAEGFKFPALRESDAMFSTDTAPEWADGDVCHRCRVAFSLIVRKHHCRACGQVFCAQCSQKSTTLPKFGIEKEVRVCDGCYDQANKPTSASKTPEAKETELPPEYVNSSLAQQNQAPPRRTEDELREEEELQLALALSQSEAEAKEKEKTKSGGALHSLFKAQEPRAVERAPTPEEDQTNPELARYLDRSYWESIKESESIDASARPTSPSAPATAPVQQNDILKNSKLKENGISDPDLEDFIATLKSQVEIFINRMKSNSSRGRSIANDSSVQTLFMNITAMHSKLLRYIQQHDDSRLHYERLQDKLTQVKDARAALDALREEHREKLRREAEEAERQRQLQMAHKLDIMRKKKQEYLQYQRQLALQRVQEQEREMQMRQEQQKQQYLMGPQFGYIGSPVHSQQFAPNQPLVNAYQFRPAGVMGGMIPGQPPQSSHQLGQPGGLPQGPQPPQSAPGMNHPSQVGPPPGFNPMPQGTGTGAPPQAQQVPPGQQHLPPQPSGLPPQQLAHYQAMNMPKQGTPQMQPGMPPQSIGMPPQNPRVPQQNQPIPQQNSAVPQQNPGMPQPGMPPQTPGIPQQPQGGLPQQSSNMGAPPNQGMHQNMPQHGVGGPGHRLSQYQQPGAPPASPQVPAQQRNGDAATAELISFD